MSNTKCCVPGCANSSGAEETLHKFPNPERDKELFNIWLYAIGGDIQQLKNNHIFKYRRVCHLHFDEKYWCRNNRLSKNAVPTKNMPGLSLNKFGYGTRPLKPIQTSEALTSKKPITITQEMDMQLPPTSVVDMQLLPSDVADKQSLHIAVKDVQLLPSAVVENEGDTRAIIETCRELAKEFDSTVGNVSSKTLTEDVSEADRCKLTVPVSNKTFGTSAEKPRPVKQVQNSHVTVSPRKENDTQFEPTVTPEKTEATVTPERTVATVTPERSEATVTPERSEATVTPERSEATVTPERTEATVTPERSEATVTHERTEATVTPERTEATVTSEISEATVTHERTEVTVTPEKTAATVTPERTEATANKNKEYWKLKLKHILHNTQFCGVCLEADVDMNALTDVLEIANNERTYRRSLTEIVDKVFREDGYCPAYSQICNNCTAKLIQSYMFIHNAEETSKMLDRHINELYTKTCYVRNNSLKDANNAQSKIYNVVIALDNKVISEDFESSQIKIEKPESHQNEKDQIRDKRKLRCVSCNVVLPSYRAWKTHERTAHTQSHRCRICLQSYKTQRALTTHYKTHLKSRCTLCHRTVQDGELLQHLNTRHKHSIHLCTTCNVAFYSVKALGSHIKECHRRQDSKCVTCLQSLSQVELERHQCRFKCPECEEAPCVHHRHLMWYREQMANLAPRAKCAECRYVCTSKEALVAHVNRQHLSLQPHRCASCGHHFYCNSHLNKHICTSEKRYKDLHMCQYCDKAFSSVYFSKRHEKGCAAIQRKYQCDDCPANFDSSKDHMKHIKLKHGKEVLSCRLCDRVFLNDLKRTRHERQAHGEQRGRASLVCVACQTEFSSKAALELHMRYHGPEAHCQLDTLGQFKSHKHRHRRSLTMCEVCGVVISRILFKKHMTAHSKVTVSCKTCGKSFQNSTLLRYHQSVHVKSAPCPRCKKLFSSAKLWRHYRNHLIRDSLDYQVAAIHGL